MILPNGMTGLERKLTSSFVRNVGGMLKEIFVDQRKLFCMEGGFHKAQWRGSRTGRQRWEDGACLGS